MGGSSGGSSFSSDDMAKMQQAAEARLKAIASGATKILFVCEQVDRQSLESHLARSKVFNANRVAVVDSSQHQQVDNLLSAATFFAAFTNHATATSFIDQVADKVLLKKIAGLHVQAHANALIPAKITAYRWRSLAWDQLEEIFK